MKQTTTRAALVCAVFACLAAVSSQEADAQTSYYIRPPGSTYGTGNGSSWTNAFAGWPSSFVRGAVYYVADGTYPSTTFKTANSGTQIITIKKATVADHGTATGWTNTMGDGEALFSGQLNFTTGYWIFDGQVRNSDWKTGYGFRINATAAKGIQLQEGGDHVTIRHTEIYGRGNDGDASPANDLVYMNAQADFFKIQNCYLHDSGRTHLLMRYADDGLVEGCYLARNESTSGQHSEGISAYMNTDRWTIRNNVWEDIDGTGIIVFSGDSWKLYGNICFETGNPNYGTHGNGGFCSWTGYTVTNARIYNNTFVRITGKSGVYFDPGFSSGNVARNNLWYDCEVVNWNGVSHDYNWFYASGTHSEPNAQYGTGSPFVSLANHDYRLAIHTHPADSSIGAPYNVDMFNTTRGGDGSWDRGAIEHVLNQPLPTYTPAAPTATRTNTPIPPSPTRTNTPGPPTNTPIPPTPTNTVPSPTPTNTLMDVGDSAVGIWGFNEGSGALALDSSTFGNDGQLVGDPAWIPSAVNGALDFDGVDDYVNCGNDPSLRQLSDTFSISFHLKSQGRGQSDYILDKNGNDVGFYLRTQPDNSLIFKLDDGADDVYLTSNNSTPLDNQWRHVAIVINGRFSAKLYVDGVVQTGGSGFLPSIGSLVNDVNLAIGAKTVMAPSNFKGCLDDVRIYNRVLSDAEIVGLRDGWIAPDAPAPSATATQAGPSPTPSRTLTATRTATRTPTRVATATPSRTPTRTVTFTPSRTPTRTATATPSPSPTHTTVPPTATATPLAPTATVTPTQSSGNALVPPAINDLRAESRYLPGQYKIVFTNPDGDPQTAGMQAGESYDIRYSLTPIETFEDFLHGQKLPYDHSPLVGGTLKGILFDNLPSGPNHFALRVQGPGGYSDPSNSAWASLYNVAPPAGLQSQAYSNHMLFLGGENPGTAREMVLRGSDFSWKWDDPHHADNSTSIEISAFGERFLSSPYWSSEWEHQNSEAHNVILVDDSTEGSQGEWMAAGPSRSTIAAIRAHMVTPRFDYGKLSTNLGSPNDVSAYATDVQLHRHVAFPDRRFFVVFDEVRAADGQSHNYGWVGHCLGTLDLTVPKTAVWTKPSGRKMFLNFLAPSVAIWNYSLPQPGPDGGTVDAPYIIAKRAGQDTQFLTLLSALDVGQAAPVVTSLQSTSGSAGKVTTPTGDFLIFCQPGSDTVTLDAKLVTNAKFAVAKIVNNALDYVFVVDQSGWIRWNNQRVFNPGGKRSFFYQSNDPAINGPSVTTVVD